MPGYAIFPFKAGFRRSSKVVGIRQVQRLEPGGQPCDHDRDEGEGQGRSPSYTRPAGRGRSWAAGCGRPCRAAPAEPSTAGSGCPPAGHRTAGRQAGAASSFVTLSDGLPSMYSTLAPVCCSNSVPDEALTPSPQTPKVATRRVRPAHDVGPILVAALGARLAALVGPLVGAGVAAPVQAAAMSVMATTPARRVKERAFILVSSVLPELLARRGKTTSLDCAARHGTGASMRGARERNKMCSSGTPSRPTRVTSRSVTSRYCPMRVGLLAALPAWGGVVDRGYCRWLRWRPRGRMAPAPRSAAPSRGRS